MKLATVLLLLVLPGGATRPAPVDASGTVTVAYPEGYRSWAHVKKRADQPRPSELREHRRFFQHIYANPPGHGGLSDARAFPDGSTIVFDWLEMREKDGAFEEGPRASGRRDGEGLTALCQYRRVGIPEIRQGQSSRARRRADPRRNASPATTV